MPSHPLPHLCHRLPGVRTRHGSSPLLHSGLPGCRGGHTSFLVPSSLGVLITLMWEIEWPLKDLLGLVLEERADGTCAAASPADPGDLVSAG